MEVAGLCQLCQRPGVLVTCPLCGQFLHPACRDGGLHAHAAGPRGAERPGDARYR